jgi:acyl-CoA thioester hydrolase
MAAPIDRLVHETRFFVRYCETDKMGIVHHANYLVYCEEARNQFSRDIGATYADFEKSGLVLVVSEIEMRYLAPAYFGQEVVIRTWVEDFKSRRLSFGYEIANPADGTLHAKAVVHLICVNAQGQVQRIPDTWKNLWGNSEDSA